MRTVATSGLTVKPTVLGFGCSSLMGRGRRHARRLLEAAFDAGIRHFDVAPLYGQGDAEWELGKFARSHRQEITLTTKIGLPPSRSNWMRRGTLSIARQAARLYPSLGVAARRMRVNAQVIVAGGVREFSPMEAQASLENSLRALRTDHVNILLLHEYDESCNQAEDVLRFFNDATKAGKITRYGVGSNFGRSLSTLRSAPELCEIMQFDSSVLTQNAAAVRPLAPASLIITHGALSESYRRVNFFLCNNRSMTEALARSLDVDVREHGMLSRLMLASALAANPEGIVLFSSRSRDRIMCGAKAASDEFTSEQVRRFAMFIIDNRDNILQAETYQLGKHPGKRC